MAGIGFALRDLMRRDSLWSIVESQLHGVVVVAGPWFFTILAMALPSLLFRSLAAEAAISEFVTLLLYVFSTSLTITGPIVMGLTRHTSDLLFERRAEAVAGPFVGAALLSLLCGVPVIAVAAAFLRLPSCTIVGAGVAYGLVTLSWIAAPMLSTLRSFRVLTAAFALGTAAFGATLLGREDVTAGDLLLGFNLGMAVTVATICGLLLRSFPGPVEPLFAVVRTMRSTWDLTLSGLCYSGGIWIAKWVMWAAPEHVELAGGLSAYPTYDTVAFLAYITTVPAFALFVIKAETSLHDRCQDLYGNIVRHASRTRLELSWAAVVRTILDTGRDVAMLQLGITALVLLMPTLVLDLLRVPHGGVFMFRFCALGAAFQSAMLMLTVVLHYFDSRRGVLLVHATFAVANGLCTAWTLQAGLPTYGLGYFLASLIGFVVAYIVVARSLQDLLYLAFVRQNATLARSMPPPPPPPAYFAARTSPEPLDAAPR